MVGTEERNSGKKCPQNLRRMPKHRPRGRKERGMQRATHHCGKRGWGPLAVSPVLVMNGGSMVPSPKATNKSWATDSNKGNNNVTTNLVGKEW